MCRLMYPEQPNSGGISKAISVLRLAESAYLAFAKRYLPTYQYAQHHPLFANRQPPNE